MKRETTHISTKNTIGTFLLIPVALFGFQSCNNESKENKTQAAVQDSSSTVVETFVLEEQPMQTQFRIPGELIAFDQVDLYAKVNSFVKKLYVDVGSRVQTGALLATLEAPEISSQYDAQTSNLKAAEAAWISSKATYERLTETSKTPGTVSANDLDVALAQRDADYARLEAAKAAQSEVGSMRNYLEVRAPFAGVITARNVSSGAYVGPSGRGSEMPIFSLKQDRKLRLTVGIPQHYVAHLQKGQKISFSVPALPGDRFEASVSRLSGTLDENIRSERVEMDVDNRSGALLPGMIAEVQLSIDASKNALIVPRSAVLRGTQGVFLIRVEQGKTTWIPVQEGNTSDDMSEVFGELQYGDTLIKNASEEIRNGVDLL